MKAVVCAYGEVGHACLDTLLGLGADVALVVTHEDAPGEKIWFSSVCERAAAAGVAVLAPEDVNAPSVVDAIRRARPEYLFSFYFRQMMGRAVLSAPTVAALNLHGSLLPRYRGRAPVNWAILHGEVETGVTLHHMDEKPDHGDIVGQHAVAITRDDTALTLTRKLARAGTQLLRDLFPALASGAAPRRPQDHTASTYFGGRRPADGRIDWTRSAEEIRNLVRAVTDPWPGAFSSWAGRRLFVWAAETRSRPGSAQAPGTVQVDAHGRPHVATGEGWLELLDVSWDGSPRQPGRTWAAQAALTTGQAFDVAAIIP